MAFGAGLQTSQANLAELRRKKMPHSQPVDADGVDTGGILAQVAKMAMGNSAEASEGEASAKPAEEAPKAEGGEEVAPAVAEKEEVPLEKPQASEAAKGEASKSDLSLAREQFNALKKMTEEQSKEKTPEESSTLAKALLAFAPALLGYATGGLEGGAMGANVGGQGLQMLTSDEKAAKDKFQKDQLSKLETQFKLAGAAKDIEMAEKQNKMLDETLRHNKAIEQQGWAKIKGEASEKTAKQQAEMAEKEVPGLQIVGKPTAKDAEELKQGMIQLENFKSNMKELKNLVDIYGMENTDTEARQLMDTYRTKAIFAYKEAAKLGVLSAADDEKLDKIIPNPATKGEWFGWLHVPGKGERISKSYDALTNQIEIDAANQARSRGYLYAQGELLKAAQDKKIADMKKAATGEDPATQSAQAGQNQAPPPPQMPNFRDMTEDQINKFLGNQPMSVEKKKKKE